MEEILWKLDDIEDEKMLVHNMVKIVEIREHSKSERFGVLEMIINYYNNQAGELDRKYRPV